MKILKTITLLGLLTTAQASDIIFDNESAQLQMLGVRHNTSIVKLDDQDLKETVKAPGPISDSWSALAAYMQTNYVVSPTQPAQMVQQLNITMLSQQLQQIETTYLSNTSVTNINFLRQQILNDQLALLKLNMAALEVSNGGYSVTCLMYYTPVFNFLVNRSVVGTTPAKPEGEPSCLDCLLKWF